MRDFCVMFLASAFQQSCGLGLEVADVLLEEHNLGGIIGFEKPNNDVLIALNLTNSVESVNFVANILMKLQDVELVGLEIEAVESCLHTEGLSLGGGEGVNGDLFEHHWAIALNVRKLRHMS
jgi:hypothetical protein